MHKAVTYWSNNLIYPKVGSINYKFKFVSCCSYCAIQEQGTKEQGTRNKEQRTRNKSNLSSDSSDTDAKANVYKLCSKKAFPIWKQKIISAASSKGYDQFLLKDVTVKTQDELDTLETDYINETDDAKRRKLKGELSKHKRERTRSLAAADLIISNVRDKGLKKLVNVS